MTHPNDANRRPAKTRTTPGKYFPGQYLDAQLIKCIRHNWEVYLEINLKYTYVHLYRTIFFYIRYIDWEIIQ